jgi:hypothetical protein
MSLGAFVFISFGFCSANSIEAKESKLSENAFTIISVLGLFSFLIGLVGAFWVNEL